MRTMFDTGQRETVLGGNIGGVTYSMGDHDNAWIEAPIDYTGDDLVAALDLADRKGLAMIPLDDPDYFPTLMAGGRIREYLIEKGE